MTSAKCSPAMLSVNSAARGALPTSGLHASVKREVQLGRYQEAKIRHFHALLSRAIGETAE